MKKTMTILLPVFFSFILFSGIALAGDSDSGETGYEIPPIAEVSLDTDTFSVTVNSAVAGSQPSNATSSSTYDVASNAGDNAKKITASINSDMPANVTLSISLAAPAGATSAGYVTLSSVAADAVTGVDTTNTTNLAVSVRLASTVSAGVISSSSRTLTLTLTDT